MVFHDSWLFCLLAVLFVTCQLHASLVSQRWRGPVCCVRHLCCGLTRCGSGQPLIGVLHACMREHVAEAATSGGVQWLQSLGQYLAGGCGACFARYACL